MLSLLFQVILVNWSVYSQDLPLISFVEVVHFVDQNDF